MTGKWYRLADPDGSFHDPETGYVVQRGKSARLGRVGKLTALKIQGKGLVECDPPAEKVKAVEPAVEVEPDVGAGLVPALNEDAVNGPVAESETRSDEPKLEEPGPPPTTGKGRKKSAKGKQ